MKLSANSSREGLIENPVRCKEGKLVNEEILKSKSTKLEIFKDRGELKYENRLRLMVDGR